MYSSVFKRAFALVSRNAYRNLSLKSSFVMTKTKVFDVTKKSTCLMTGSFSTEVSPLSDKDGGGKVFKEFENELAHKIFENNASYANTVIVHPIKDVKNGKMKMCNSGNIFERFSKETLDNFEVGLTIEDRKFNNLVDAVIKSFSGASDDDILHVLYCLSVWPPTATTYLPNFKSIWNKLDDECVRRLEKWSVDQKLLVGDHWFHLQLSRISKYNSLMVKSLIQRSDTLTSRQIVQLMFYVNLQRSVPQSLLSTLDKKIQSMIGEMSIEEISIICLGYFKNEAAIKNGNTVRTIMKETVSQIDNINSDTIVRILKCLRKSYVPYIWAFYVPFVQKLTTKIEDWEVIASIHSILLCSVCSVFEPALLDCAVNRILQQLSNVRIKDMGKLLQCLALFNYPPSDEFNVALLEELSKKERLEEIWRFPRDLPFMVMYYTYLGQYWHHLIEHVLTPRYVEHCVDVCGEEMLGILSVIDFCVEIECPGYSGPRLDPKFFYSLDGREGRIRDMNGSDKQRIIGKCNFNVARTLTELYGSSNVVISHVLPHMFNPIVVLRVSAKNTCPEPLPEISARCPPLSILSPPSDEIWICFVICSNFSYHYGSKRLYGWISMKERQLQRLGYIVDMIPFHKVPRDDVIRKSFIKKRVAALRNHVKAM